MNRPTSQFDSDGNRIYEELTFEVPYSTSTEIDNYLRFLAKIIDLATWVLVFYYLLNFSAINTIIYSFIALMLFNSVVEYIFGHSLGKAIFGIKVVDDFGKNPGLFRSLMRNLSSPLNILFSRYQSFGQPWSPGMPHTIFNMEQNNFLCKTYTIRRKKLAEIKEKLNSGKVF